MSRIGNKIIKMPAGVEFINENNLITVKGPNGTLSRQFADFLDITVEEEGIQIKTTHDSIRSRSIHGTSRSLIENMIVGVTDKFSKRLEIVGVGYRAALENDVLILNVGYSNPVHLDIPEGITITLPRNTVIIVEGIDKQLVGEFSANIRKTRKPEPYKGKGIRYSDEVVRRKEGKTVV